MEEEEEVGEIRPKTMRVGDLDETIRCRLEDL